MKYVTDKVILAAKRLGRQYIGIDIDEEYIKIAKEKLVGAVPLCQPVVKFMEPKGYVYQYKSPQPPFEKGGYNKTGKKRPRGNDSFALNHTVRDDQFEFDTTRLKKEHQKMMQKENQKAQLILFENYRDYSAGEKD